MRHSSLATRNPILGQLVERLLPARYRARHQAGLARVQAGGAHHVIGTTVEMQGLRRDGSEFPLLLSLSEWWVAGQQFYTAIIHDVTARKQAEVQLQESHRQLAETLTELRATQQQIIQQEQLRGLSQMASGIAHTSTMPCHPSSGLPNCS